MSKTETVILGVVAIVKVRVEFIRMLEFGVKSLELVKFKDQKQSLFSGWMLTFFINIVELARRIEKSTYIIYP